MHCPHLLLSSFFGILKGESQYTLGCGSGYEFNTLYDSIDNYMFNTGILTLSILADKNGVDVVVRSLVAGDGFAWAHIGKEVESSSESKI